MHTLLHRRMHRHEFQHLRLLQSFALNHHAATMLCNVQTRVVQSSRGQHGVAARSTRALLPVRGTFGRAPLKARETPYSTAAASAVSTEVPEISVVDSTEALNVALGRLEGVKRLAVDCEGLRLSR